MRVSGILLVALGVYMICSAIFKWDVLLHGYKSNMVTGVIGEEGARLVYGIVGGILMIIGLIGAIIGH